jgi:cystathionine gamma-synthase
MKLNHKEADTLFEEDAIVLDENSKGFQGRVEIMNRNTEELCDFLLQHPRGTPFVMSEFLFLYSIAIVKNIFCPKYVDTKKYLACATSPQKPGYGSLFSLILSNKKQAQTFYDALQVAKGPSLGTEFTLVCPYTVLAHYWELDWAAQYGKALTR